MIQINGGGPDVVKTGSTLERHVRQRMLNNSGWFRGTVVLFSGEGRRAMETVSVMTRRRKPARSPVESAKAYLCARQRDLELRLHSVERSRQQRVLPQPRNSEERALERENDKMLDHLADITRDELARVDRAMHRLNTGHYGECECCSSPIGEARLRVVPEATLCSRCARPHSTS